MQLDFIKPGKIIDMRKYAGLSYVIGENLTPKHELPCMRKSPRADSLSSLQEQYTIFRILYIGFALLRQHATRVINFTRKRGYFCTCNEESQVTIAVDLAIELQINIMTCCP
jgi:hypothetical protein